MAVGIAHALKKKGLEHKVYCVVGDGEVMKGLFTRQLIMQVITN